MQTYFTQMTHCSQRFPISDSKDIDDFLVGLIGMATLKAYKIDKSCYWNLVSGVLYVTGYNILKC